MLGTWVKKFSCETLTASAHALCLTTAEMERSELPCAMATTFTRACAKRCEEFRRHAFLFAHAVTDQADDRHIGIDAERIEQMRQQLQFEFGFQGAARALQVLFGDAETDRELGRGLGDQVDRDLLARHRREYPRCHADHALQTRPGDGDQGQMLQAGNAFDQSRVALRADARTGRRRIQGVLDVAGNAGLRQRADGFRMQDLGTEIRQFHGFGITELLDQFGVFDLTRIGAVHAVDIGPDFAGTGARRRPR